MYFTNTLENVLADAIHIRVFKILSLHSEGLTGRAIGGLVQTSSFKINQVLRDLVSQGIVLETVAGRAHLYRLNQEHILTQQLINQILFFEKNLLPDLGKFLMKQLKPKPLSIIIYGSVARGDEKPTSDIDIFIIYANKNESPGKISNLDFLMTTVTTKFGNPVAIRRSWHGDFKSRFRKKDPLIQNIVKEGKCIAGVPIMELLET